MLSVGGKVYTSTHGYRLATKVHFGIFTLGVRDSCLSQEIHEIRSRPRYKIGSNSDRSQI